MYIGIHTTYIVSYIVVRMYYNICYIVIKNAKRKLHTLCKCKNTATYTAWRGTWKATACGSKIFSLVKILVHY